MILVSQFSAGLLAHAGNEQSIVLLPGAEGLFIDPTDTPNVYMWSVRLLKYFQAN